MTEIERVAFVGDWHMNWRWGGRAIRYGADQGAQHFVHTGDYGYTFQQQFLDEIDSVLRATGTRLWFVPGNHDSYPWLSRVAYDEEGKQPLSDRVACLPRGFRWEWGGVRFLAMGGAHSVDRMARVPGREWWPEETITPRQVHQAGAQGPTDVIVSHDAPAGCVIPGIDDVDAPSWIPPAELKLSFEHRLRFQTLCSVTQPSSIWHGHYHVRHRTLCDLGYGPVVVNGLDCDESSLDTNVVVRDVAELLVRVELPGEVGRG